MPALKINTWNSQGLNDIGIIQKFEADYYLDVLCVQEAGDLSSLFGAAITWTPYFNISYIDKAGVRQYDKTRLGYGTYSYYNDTYKTYIDFEFLLWVNDIAANTRNSQAIILRKRPGFGWRLAFDTKMSYWPPDSFQVNAANIRPAIGIKLNYPGIAPKWVFTSHLISSSRSRILNQSYVASLQAYHGCLYFADFNSDPASMGLALGVAPGGRVQVLPPPTGTHYSTRYDKWSILDYLIKIAYPGIIIDTVTVGAKYNSDHYMVQYRMTVVY